MTNNHLLIYRLAELMLEKQQHILSLDDLFEDEQIGAFVRSIQIDSPYQQLIFEGVLTESIKDERVMVTFTVEGYFHYVLGEVIEKQTEVNGAKALKELLENNKLRGITEGIEQCLVRDVEKNDLSRLMWLIDEGGKALDASAYPLAQAFLIHPIERVINELLADPSDNDIKVLEKAITKLESAQQNDKVKNLYQVINNVLEPNNILKATLYVKSIKYIPKEHRKEELNKLSSLKFKKLDEKTRVFFSNLGHQFNYNSNFHEAIICFKKCLEIHQKTRPNSYTKDYRSLSVCYSNIDYKLSHKYSIKSWKHGLQFDTKQYTDEESDLNNIAFNLAKQKEFEKALNFYLLAWEKGVQKYGKYHTFHALANNNVAINYSEIGEYKKAQSSLLNALEINRKIMGKCHMAVGLNLNNLCWLNNKFKNYESAIKFGLEASKIYENSVGTNHFKTAINYNNLGNAFFGLNKKKEARIFYNKAYDIFRSKLGEDHQHTKLLSKKLKDLNDQ